MEFLMISQLNALIAMMTGLIYLSIKRKHRGTFLKWFALIYGGIAGGLILFIVVHHMY